MLPPNVTVQTIITNIVISNLTICHKYTHKLMEKNLNIKDVKFKNKIIDVIGTFNQKSENVTIKKILKNTGSQ